MCHKKAGNRLFSFAVDLEGENFVPSYYGSLTYTDPDKESQETKRYGKEYIRFMAKFLCM